MALFANHASIDVFGGKDRFYQGALVRPFTPTGLRG
jgi:hypothetical protein